MCVHLESTGYGTQRYEAPVSRCQKHFNDPVEKIV